LDLIGALSGPGFEMNQHARISGIAVQTLRNQICQGRCQLETIKLGGRRYVRVQDLADFLDGVRGATEPIQRRTGRLTKREEIERRNGRL
jgi:hypothetical protein